MNREYDAIDSTVVMGANEMPLPSAECPGKLLGTIFPLELFSCLFKHDDTKGNGTFWWHHTQDGVASSLFLPTS